MESQGLSPAWDCCARGPLSRHAGRGGWGVGRPLRPRSKGLLAPLCRFSPPPHLPWLFSEPPELGAHISGRQKKTPFCPIHKYLLSALTSWRPHTLVHSTCPETVQVGSSERKKLDSLREEGSRGRSVLFLRLPNVIRNFSFAGMDLIEKLLNRQE